MAWLRVVHAHGFSRTCGGDSMRHSFATSCLKFFPHMRGSNRAFVMRQLGTLVFPAHAGVEPTNYVIRINIIGATSR